MWAHYADNHGGICIGVDPERVIASCGVAVSGDISYQDKPFSLKFDAREDTRAMLRRLAPALFIKDSRWSYEQEVRLITFQQPPVQQAPEAVVAVALGLRVTPQTRERVMHWKEVRPHLRILEARQNEKAYDLELVQVA